MNVAVASRAIERISRATDPKKAIIEEAGDLSGIELIGDQVLLGIHFRPEKSAGGIIRPQTNIEEDAYQGKAGLVLKLGPDAFVDPETGLLYEQRFAVGDWGVFKVSEGWNVLINGCPCRLVRDVALRLKLKNPNVIF